MKFEGAPREWLGTVLERVIAKLDINPAGLSAEAGIAADHVEESITRLMNREANLAEALDLLALHGQHDMNVLLFLRRFGRGGLRGLKGMAPAP